MITSGKSALAQIQIPATFNPYFRAYFKVETRARDGARILRSHQQGLSKTMRAFDSGQDPTASRPFFVLPVTARPNMVPQSHLENEPSPLDRQERSQMTLAGLHWYQDLLGFADR